MVQVLAEALAARLAEQPGRPALADSSGAWSRGELLLAGDAAARAFRAQGVAAGDRVLLRHPPSRDFAVAALALLRLGACVVPVRPACTPRELQHVVADALPRFGCGPTAAAAELAEAGVQILDAGAARAGGRLSWPALREEDPALILYTSGTTRRPRGALHSQRSVLANLEALGRCWRWSADDHLLLCLPLYHLHGLCVGLLGALVSGMQVTLHARFVAADAGTRLRAGGITLFYGVPALYAALLAGGLEGPLPDLRALLCGSAPLAPALRRTLEERLGAPVVERYGTTETGIVLSQDLRGQPAGTVGVPLPGCAVALADCEGAELPDRGELLVQGPALFRGYWNDAGGTEAVLRDGFYRTGDLVERRPGGAYRILGRLSTDLFKVRGHKVAALEVEAALAEHPAVTECAVVAVPHASDGDAVHAFVCCAGPRPDPEALRAHLRQHLASYQVPREIHLVAELPHVGPGKVDKAALRARLAAP